MEKLKDKDFLNIEEIRNLIDERFSYTFEGKDENDHLISAETWHSYITNFFEKLEDEEKDWSVYKAKWLGARKNRRYPINFVEEIIEFNSELLKKQYNSNRKTMIDKDWVNFNKALMGWSDTEIPKSVYEKRVIITEYELRKNNSRPQITKDDKEKVKRFFIDAIIDDLIDTKKLETDIEEWTTNGELIYGYADPLEMIEDDKGPIGYKVDRKKYLKDKVINEIKNS